MGVGTEEDADGPKPVRVAIADLLRAAFARARRHGEVAGEAAAGGSVAREPAVPSPDPEEIADLVEVLLAQSRRTEGLAMARVAELERRLAERDEQIVALAEELRRAHHEITLERRARERLIERIGLRLAAPLANLLGLVEAARASKPYSAGLPWLRAADRVGHELARGLEDWRVEAEAAPEAPGLIAFRPGEALGRVTARAQELADARGLVVESRDHTEAELEVLGDPILLERVLDTLVQHGFERTRRGFVLLELRAVPLDDRTVALEVDVEDTARRPGGEVERGVGPDALAGETAERLLRTAQGLAERLGGWLEHRTSGELSSWRLTVDFPLSERGRRAG